MPNSNTNRKVTPIRRTTNPTDALTLEMLNCFAKSGIHSIDGARVYLTILIDGPCSISHVVNRLELPFSTVSRFCSSMNKADLVDYKDHNFDRRIRIVEARPLASQP